MEDDDAVGPGVAGGTNGHLDAPEVPPASVTPPAGTERIETDAADPQVGGEPGGGIERAAAGVTPETGRSALRAGTELTVRVDEPVATIKIPAPIRAGNGAGAGASGAPAGSAGPGESGPPNGGFRLDVSGTQVCASALASTSAAVVASVFGVTGTVIGAAIGSVIVTIGSAVYSASIRRTHERLQEIEIPVPVTRFVPLGLRTTGSTGVADDRPSSATAAGPVVTVDPGNGSERSGDGDEPGPGADRRRRDGKAWLSQRRWGVVAAIVVAFVASLGVVTLVELVSQKPISSIAGWHDSKGTSVGDLFGGDEDDEDGSDGTSTSTTTGPSDQSSTTTGSTPDTSAPSSDEQPDSTTSSPTTGPEASSTTTSSTTTTTAPSSTTTSATIESPPPSTPG